MKSCFYVDNALMIISWKRDVESIQMQNIILGSQASFGSCYRIFLYVLTTIFLRFRKAYSFKNLKNKVSNCFFGLYGNIK